MHSNVSYLQKMQTDADFLFTADGARMLAGLGVAPEEAALASFPVALLGNREPEDMPVAVRCVGGSRWQLAGLHATV